MKYMEDNLETPLKQILAVMQDRVMEETSYFGVKTLKNILDS